ncbi:MAG: hypothetical protein QF578_23795 [Alphaproteobacteria bacterium]|nr:hypothetical protein [Alphaproteobacteria bacterium]MDP6813125.1 hypothetical protein [Alphaproteobacteria bacterium]
MKSAYRLAIYSAAFPTVLGTAVFIAWTVRPSDLLFSLGFGLILSGAMLFVVGLGSLVSYIILARRAGVSFWRPVGIAMALLLGNLPLCAFYVVVVMEVANAHFVIIKNASASPIEDLVVTDSYKNAYEWPPVAPGETQTRCFRFRGEGGVAYSFVAGGQRQDGFLNGYLEGFMGQTHFELQLLESLEVKIIGRLPDNSEAEYERSGRKNTLLEYLEYCGLGEKEKPI